MAPKKRTVDKVPAGTGDAADSGSTSNVIGGNDPTLDLGKDPSQTVSAVSEMNTILPTTRNTRVTDQLAHPASEQGTSEDPTQTPNPHGAKTRSSLKLTQMTLSQVNDWPRPIQTLRNWRLATKSKKCSILLTSTWMKSNSALEARTRTLQTRLIAIRKKYLMIAKGKSSIHPRDPTKDPNNEDVDPHSEQPINWSNNYVDEESTNGQHNVNPELIQSTDGSNNRSDPKQALGNAWTELLAKTAILEWLYADQAPADHLNQAATAA
ncbi:hypothetical protein M422DRAFT_245119 [Sphaerobolus stellatus SS14]|nr:hypothetical protein M422DRAFT_245119 [Sphaerobolus stellatus SS14]